MDKKLQKVSSPFSRSVGGSSQKDSVQEATNSHFQQCPICFSNIIRTTIELHVEECLKMNTNVFQCQIKDVEGEMIQTNQANDEVYTQSGKDEYINCSSMETVNMGLKASPEGSRLLGGEWKPLAERMRPTQFCHMSGDKEIIGESSIVRVLLERDPPPSVILCGPPGCGKTTIATVISKHTRCPFISLSCCTATTDDIRSIITRAENEFQLRGLPTVLFMDEIHRFNTKQQDLFLSFVEKGILILIGATTENPSFSINAALLSRCQVIPMKLLTVSELERILERAMRTDSVLLSSGMKLSDEVKRYLALRADGDARTALTLLESCYICVNVAIDKKVTVKMIDSILREHYIRYDKHGEEHYNIISAFHKAIRGSDVQASVYWLTRMLEGGEDPLYVARRLIRCSTEDIGLADPQAFILATKCFRICKDLGAPFCYPLLTQCVSYMALASKSNELYLAYGKTVSCIQDTGTIPVPTAITSIAEYDYTIGRNYLPEGVQGQCFVDIARAITDLRIQSIHKYTQPENIDQELPTEDANLVELPLEKRMRIDISSMAE